MLYACDARWWKHRGAEAWEKFAGMKAAGDQEALKYFPDLMLAKPDRELKEMRLAPVGHVGWGGNSGFHAVHLALQFGVKRIILVGFDMQASRQLHWHGPHRGGLANPLDVNFRRWRKLLERAAPQIKAHGVDVINASATTALTCFRRQKLQEALACLD